MAKRNPGQDENQPRRDEERDRWREGGYRGHGTEEFGPEAREQGGTGGAGDLHQDEPVDGAAERSAGPNDAGRRARGGQMSEPDFKVARPRDSDSPAAPGYTGFSTPGGRTSPVPPGGGGDRGKKR